MDPKKNKRWIVGLTGKNAAGKGVVAHYLGEHGYRYRSLSDALREEARRRNLPDERESLITLGQELRRSNGPGVLARRTADVLEAGPHVIDSIRHPDEVRILREEGNFLLLGVDAPLDLRFHRAMDRGRTENAGTIEEFRAMEDRERTADPNAQQLDRCLEMADLVLPNDGAVDELERRVRATIKERAFPFD